MWLWHVQQSRSQRSGWRHNADRKAKRRSFSILMGAEDALQLMARWRGRSQKPRISRETVLIMCDVSMCQHPEVVVRNSFMYGSSSRSHWHKRDSKFRQEADR
mmetsp:Transcript_24288/g.56616  ORF Transcript_24288/g.56616 Transcript_24288/m.56616 type:complete len:103 (-) Transcript_24288:46-354(-)